MTAPRMTDEEFEAQCGALHRAPVYTEAVRARAAESAALARVRRLEEALREFGQAFTDLDLDDQASRRRMRLAHIQARAALSEET